MIEGLKPETPEGFVVTMHKEVCQQEVSISPDSKVYGVCMGPTWGRQEPGGPHVGPTNLALWVSL